MNISAPTIALESTAELIKATLAAHAPVSPEQHALYLRHHRLRMMMHGSVLIGLGVSYQVLRPYESVLNLKYARNVGKSVPISFYNSLGFFKSK